MSIQKNSPLLFAGLLVSRKLKEAEIELYNYQLINDGRNYHFNTEIGNFLIKGEKKYWFMAERDSEGVLHGPSVTINEEIYNEWIVKHNLVFLYHCFQYGDVIKYLDNEKGIRIRQPSNNEVVIAFPEKSFIEWMPKKEFVRYW